MRKMLFAPAGWALAALALILPLAALAACGGDDKEGSTPTGETRAGETNAAAGAVLEVAGSAEETMALADVQEASMRLPSPDWVTFHGGYLWVKQDDGMVVRIDPRTNKPNGKVRADTKSEHLCQGIGSGGGAVWSCSGSDIVRIDPKRLKVTDSIPVGKVFDEGKLVFVDGRIWVLTGEGDSLVGIDTATASPGPPIDLPDACGELAPGPGMVWVLCPIAGKVLAVDPASASVEAELEIDSPSFAVATKSDLWVGSAGDLVRVDLETLEPVARFLGLDPGLDGDVAVAGDDVWVRTPAGFLHRIDAASNTVAEQIEADEALSGGAVLPAQGSLWITAFNDSLLLRLRPDE
jgi:streptogramin lyase